VADALITRLKAAYASVPVGDPRAEGTLVGPLIDEAAFAAMQIALTEAMAEGGVVHGGQRVERPGVYVRPAIVEMPAQTGPMLRETFAPILYVVRYRDLAEAIALQNATAAGLASSIFTNDIREAELFVSDVGSDCGIANINIGPSGAEIGGAFGGEKDTGGGRESGSDAWKAYMRRQTQTVNFSRQLPLAQGVRFDV
jgi:aldehyde dehydrogenase (NAD+)